MLFMARLPPVIETGFLMINQESRALENDRGESFVPPGFRTADQAVHAACCKKMQGRRI
jgi:hypothetical protein